MKLIILILFIFGSVQSRADSDYILRQPADSDGMIKVIPPAISNLGKKRVEPIKGWEPITVSKGFILSNELYYKRLCAKVWSKQIPAFKEKNPEVKDVDKFYPGDKILIQICEQTFKKKEKKENVIVPEIVEEKKEVKVETPLCPQVVCCNQPVEKKEDTLPIQEDTSNKKAKDYDLDGMIFAGLGFLSEDYQKQLYNYTSFRYGIKKDIYQQIGYKLTLDFTKDVIFGSNKIQVKTTPDKHQYYFSFGMGNRLGLKKREDFKLSDNLTTYSTVGAGVLYNFRGVEFDIEAYSTLNANSSTNFSVSGVKKISENYSLGAYFDIQSTDPKINDIQAQRSMITGGILILF